MKKLFAILGFLFLAAVPARAQLGTIQGFCDNGGNHALTSGQPSSNYLQGDIPLCTVSVFYHDTTTLAPIFMGESSTGTVQSVQVTTGGSYSVCPTGVTFTGGGGSGATATVSCTAGAVVSVAVTSPGSGYTTAPTVSFTGGTGSGATAVATIVGDLTNPFQANTDGSWRVWAAIATGYDVTMSGGIPPNAYAQPRTITNIFPNAFGGTSYTIIQANGTASAPTSPVNFINSGTVDFSITGNQVSAAVNVGSTLALKHNSSSSGILQTLYNLCDNGSCGPALDAGMQPVLAKTGTNDGSWVLETASTATQIQQLPTGLPASGQHVIIYPQAGSTSCSAGSQCSYAVGPGAWMQMSNTGTIFGAGSSVNLTGTALPAGVLDANVTAAYNCATGYASGYGAKSIPNAALTSANISYATYCTKVASGPGYNYAGATWQSAMSCSSGCSGQSMFSYAQPFMVVYYSGTPVTTNYLSFATPLIVQGQTVGLTTGWPTVIDTGAANAYVSGAPWVTQLNPGQEVILVAQTANTGASTFAFNGAPAASIVKAGGAALSAGDITATAPALLIYQTGGAWLDVDPQTGGGSSAVSSVSNSDGSLTVSPTTGAVIASINYAHAGTWTGLETFSAGVSASALTLSGITGSTQCLHVNSSGVVSGTGSDCGSGSGGLTVGSTTISGGTSGNGLYDNAGVLGEKAFAPALGNCTVETANFTATAASCYVGNASSGITATLPAISTGAIIRIQNINSGTVTASFGSNFNCTLNGTTTSTTTCAIANGSTGLVTTDGTNWYVFVAPSAASSGLSGQTTNYLPLATSATASTTSSIVSQNSTTSVTVNTTGTAYGLTLPEGTTLTPTTGEQIFNSNSTSHTTDLSSNGGAFSPICTAANGECQNVPGPFYEGYTYVADTTAAAVTSPPMSVTSGDLLVVSCRGGTGTTVTATDSGSNTYTALTAQSPSSSQILQVSWAIASTTASITFTCTQSASAAGISLIAMHWSATGGTPNTSAGASNNTGASPITSPAITTSQRALFIQCASEGALTSWTLGNMANGFGQVVGVSQSSVQATNADQGCQARVLTAAYTSVWASITPGTTSGYGTTVLAFNW